MRKHDWLWAACIAGVVFCSCSDDSKKTDAGPDDGQAVCGNSIVESSEACDDGNEVDGDGCAGDCSKVESGFTCPAAGGACTKETGPDDPGPGPGPDPNPDEPGCGNGVLDEGEVCDDGNVFSFDGCTADCLTIEPNYECTTPGELCVPIEIEDDVCGDCKVTGYEVCDDGNTDPNDGCDQFCNVEYGWLCDDTGCHTVCGDGIIMGDEACDDENNENGDGCKADCSGFEEGFDCTEEMGKTYCKSQTCGSGVVNEGEECDYGEESASEDSQGYGWNSLLGEPYCFFCQFTSFCGDGITNSGEQCDEGSLGEDGKPVLKDTEGKPIGGLGTYGGCKADCTLAAHCGDGNVDPGEECDAGEQNGNNAYGGCTVQCKLGARCGDGIVQDEEFCDEGIVDASGKAVGGTGEYGHCNADCSGYPSGFCGDGLLAKGYEQCDLGGYETDEDGNQKLDEEGNPIPKFVDENGYIVGGDGSYGGCNADCTKAAFCGDGNTDLEDGELCDEGISQGADTYVGGLGGYDECKADCSGIAEFCGDGITNGNEECDLGGYETNDDGTFKLDENGDLIPRFVDENGYLVGGDGSYNGCNADCTWSAERCGDGVVQSEYGEICDEAYRNQDGITVGGSGLYGSCYFDCMKWSGVCGDGEINSAGEECDEGTLDDKGNPSLLDGNGKPMGGLGGYGKCKANCTRDSFCGDGITDTDHEEECDDGVYVGGEYVGGFGIYGGCNANCTRAAYCGDGHQDPSEQCDLGAANNVGGYGGCNADCTKSDYCGDGITNGTEECDNGIYGNKDGQYNGCTTSCKLGPRCGDNIIDTAYGEKCDKGAANSTIDS